MKNYTGRRYRFILFLFIFSFFPVMPRVSAGNEQENSFHFTVTADMRYNHKQFRETCKAIKSEAGGPGAFHVSVGDVEPVDMNRKIIDEEFGGNTTWYVVVGNHELDDPKGLDMKWIREQFYSLPGIVNKGPAGCEETTYSFDYRNAHFIVLNEYYDGKSDTGTDGDVVPELLSWLKEDLDKNTKPAVFVFGHEPAFPVPDEHWGTVRHKGDSLNRHAENRDAFWNLLEDKGAAAYICGHIHRYSHYRHEEGNVWQITAVTYPPPDNDLKYDAWLDITVSDKDIRFEVYRDLDRDGTYIAEHSWTALLNPL
jgi:hypothetical protein